MSSTQDDPSQNIIKPLLQDIDLGAEMRTVLDARTNHEPMPRDLAKLQARLAAALPPGTLPPATPPTTPGGGGGVGGAPVVSGAKALAVIAAIGVAMVGVAAVIATQPSTTTTTTPTTTATAVPPEPTATASASAAVSASASVSSSSAPPPIKSAVAPPPLPEPVLLSKAHEALLQGAPAKALEITNEHARAYPAGSLAQEREVIAIESLAKLGRKDEAKQRAKRFHAAFPGSSHGDRVDRLVAE